MEAAAAELHSAGEAEAEAWSQSGEAEEAGSTMPRDSWASLAAAPVAQPHNTAGSTGHNLNRVGRISIIVAQDSGTKGAT